MSDQTIQDFNINEEMLELIDNDFNVENIVNRFTDAIAEKDDNEIEKTRYYAQHSAKGTAPDDTAAAAEEYRAAKCFATSIGSSQVWFGTCPATSANHC